MEPLLKATFLPRSSATLRTGLSRYEFNVKPLTPAVAAEQQRIADTFHGLGLIPRAIRVSDAVRQTGA